MGFLADFWNIVSSSSAEAIERIYHSKSKQWVAQFVPSERAAKLPLAKEQPLISQQHYITVTAQKTVLPYDRVLLRTFYGAVHSTIIVHDDAGEPRSLTTFASLDPTLTAIDKRAGEKMVQGPRTLLEFAPFRGTAIGSTIALLAVEAVNYAKPLLATLQKMSDIAGVQFFTAAGALAEPLISGVQALCEVAGGSGTQIVYAGNLPLRTGLFLIAGIEANEFNWPDYTFASDYTLLKGGAQVDEFAYMVVSIEATESRPNWRQIPELRDAEVALDTAVKAAGRKIADPSSEEYTKVETARLAMEWMCLNSVDLCPADGEHIADLIKAKIENFARRASGVQAPLAIQREFSATTTLGFSLDDIDPFPRP
jgi:hypothetical protein